jgi:hypothetical protein
MKTTFASALGALMLPLAAAKVSYDGYKAFRIDADFAGVERALADIDFVELSCLKSRNGVDIAVAPESLEAFEALGLTASVITEDVGADFAREGAVRSYVGMSALFLAAYIHVVVSCDSPR